MLCCGMSLESRTAEFRVGSRWALPWTCVEFDSVFDIALHLTQIHIILSIQ